MLDSATCPFGLWAFSPLGKKPFTSSKRHVGPLQGRKPIHCGCRQIRKRHLGCHSPCSGVIGDNTSAPSSASLYSPPGFFKARLVVGSVKPPAYASWASSSSLPTWKAGGLQLGVIRLGQWSLPPLQLDLEETWWLGSPCHWYSGTVSCQCTHTLESIGVNTADTVLLHMNSIG